MAATPEKPGPVTILTPERLLPPTQQVVRLNARGTLLYATVATLTKKPNSVLARAFANTSRAATSSELFVDADPALLDGVLRWLSDGEVVRLSDAIAVRRFADFARALDLDALATEVEIKPWTLTLRIVTTQQELASLVAARCLACCDLRHVPLRGMVLPALCDCSHACLAGMDLSHCNTLRGVSLAGADLTGANLRGADLTETLLAEAKLTGANLMNATLCRANLRNADLSGAFVKGARFTDAACEGVIVTNVKLDDAIGFHRP